MWVLRWVLISLLILAVLGFALQNQSQTVSVRILQWNSPIMPLYFFLYLAFGAGMLFWVLMSAFNMLKMKNEIYRVSRENRRIKEELNRLRNISIDEEMEDSELEGEMTPVPKK